MATKETTKKGTRKSEISKTRKSTVKQPATKTRNVKGKSDPKMNEFSFGGMSKEERRAFIDEAIGASKKSKPSLEYTVEGTGYSPTEWVDVLTPGGILYQEPVPRYMDSQHFIYVLAAIPSSPVVGNRISFDAEIYKTAFNVKGVDCVISTVNFDGNRKENPYADVFGTENGTLKVGGNLVFSKDGKGFTAKESEKVMAEIVKRLNGYKEIV